MQALAPTIITARMFPRSRVATGVLVVGFALLTAAAAQVSIPLGFTPVPITGQTFAVLLSGAALGSAAGAMSMGLYLLMGLAGLPFFADGSSGWKVVSGATGGYLIGFILAAAAIGFLAERRQDRSLTTALPAFLAGTVVIYLVGVPWLAASIDVSGTRALELGLVPFVIGDLLKVALAGLLLPTAWKLVGGTR